MKEKQYCYQFPRPSVACDTLLFSFKDNQLWVLLIERGNEPFKGKWAFPGGFLDMDETAEECAARELQEETAVNNIQLYELGCFSGVKRDPRTRVITISFIALAKMDKITPQAGDDAAKTSWFPLTDMPSLAFDQDLMLEKGIARLREKALLGPVLFNLLPEIFTIDQIYQLYMALYRCHVQVTIFTEQLKKKGIILEAGEGIFKLAENNYKDYFKGNQVIDFLYYDQSKI